MSSKMAGSNPGLCPVKGLKSCAAPSTFLNRSELTSTKGVILGPKEVKIAGSVLPASTLRESQNTPVAAASFLESNVHRSCTVQILCCGGEHRTDCSLTNCNVAVLLYEISCLLGEYANCQMRILASSRLLCVCLSVCPPLPHGTTRLPLGGFS